MVATGTPLTSLNAIKLSAREVAATFVAPPAFEALLHADNAVLTGPRGSGKTTLLKMMQSEALEHWSNNDADLARASARSVGVFIGSDRTWNEQLAMPGDDVDPSTRTALTSAAFTSHVLRSLTEAMDFRLRGPSEGAIGPHLRVALESVDEPQLAARLSSLAGLTFEASTLPSLRTLFADRIVEVGRLRARVRRHAQIELPNWVDLDFIAVADAMVAAFNEFADQPDQKWSLLFDELELAPPALVEELLGALRGSQPRLLFKLSLAPANARFDVLEHEHAPVPGQDYEHVPLTYARKLPALRFAKTLVAATLSQGGAVQVPPVEQLLGPGALDSRDDYDADETTPTRAYEVGSPLWRAMERLQSRDPTFNDYLRNNGLDLSRLDELDPRRRAARLRKIRNIVVVREFFKGEDGRRRSRKTFALYTGADSILSLPDGNPRMIISLVRQLFPGIETNTPAAKVRTPAQSAAIESTLHRFMALLEAQQAVQVGGRSVGLIQLADKIGDSLAARLIERPFSDNVALTFRIPSELDSSIKTLFIRGINAGAFVHIPPRHGGERLSGDIVGRQFRLSHLLATKYGLPIHLTPATSLSDHLPAAWVGQALSSPDALVAQQGSLFGPGEEQ